MKGTPLKKFGFYRVTQPHRRYTVGGMPGYDAWDLWDTRTDTLVGFGLIKESVDKAGELLQYGNPAFSPLRHRRMVVESHPRDVTSLFDYYQFVFSGSFSRWVNGGLLPWILDPVSKSGRVKTRLEAEGRGLYDVVLGGKRLFPPIEELLHRYNHGSWPIPPSNPFEGRLPNQPPPTMLRPVDSQSPFRTFLDNPTLPISPDWKCEMKNACTILLALGVGNKEPISRIHDLLP